MGLRNTRWLIAGGALLVLASSASALWVIARSPTLAEWFTGLDAERDMIVPRANKNDRLPLPDPVAVAARTDAEAFRRLGRPPVEAIWAARMTLPSPAEWIRQSSPPAPVDPSAPIAYAAARATEPAQRDPFRVIDEGAGSPAPQASVPMPLPRPVVEPEEDEEEEEAEIIPIPMPRPRNLAAIPSVSAVPLPPVRAVPMAPQTQTQTAAPAAPPSPVPPPRQATRNDPSWSADENPSRVGMDPRGRTQVAALSVVPRDTEPAQRPPAPTIMTPFGVPYTLQHASVETQCFPPQLVDLLRRIERTTGQKPIITSGYRTRGRSGSLHRRCMAADIMVPGVSSTELARIARTIPGMGGVGQYCHPNLVHVDIGTARDWKYGCGSFFALREPSTPSTVATPAAASASGSTFSFGARGFTR